MGGHRRAHLVRPRKTTAGLLAARTADIRLPEEAKGVEGTLTDVCSQHLRQLVLLAERKDGVRHDCTVKLATEKTGDL